MDAGFDSSTLGRAMQARRCRILEEAGRLLAAGGPEALTLRTLADNSDVTVPTIYNLIGGKEQVVAALIEATLDTIDAALAALPEQRGFARAEAAVRGHLTLCLSAPDRYGALYRALHGVQSGGVKLAGMFVRAGEVYVASVREAAKSGDLHGRLKPVPLAHHILHGQIETFRLWGVGALAAGATEARALYSLHVTLMADATKQGRRLLLERIRASESRLK